MSKVIAAMQSGRLPMPTTEPAANPQALTEEMKAAAREAWRRSWYGNPSADAALMAGLKAAFALTRPAADRGQIVEECAKAAEQHADQYNHQNDYQENALWNECYEVAAAIRALPAPAQTTEDKP